MADIELIVKISKEDMDIMEIISTSLGMDFVGDHGLMPLVERNGG